MILDELLGDPRCAHPVAAFGSAASALERRCYADTRAAGARFTAAAVVPVVVAGCLLERWRAGRPAVVALATWTVLGGRSLRRAALAMASSLDTGDLAAARAQLPSLCGRDPKSLDTTGLARATVESVAENTSDAVVAPLVWGAVAGVPGLLGYRAVNTLDAMVGHRSPRYARYGTASARLDDLANLVPARLTAVLMLASGNARAGWVAWRRGAGRHPSPNAGVCEAAAAGVLGLRLGGTTVYGGRIEERPVLGDGPAPTPDDIRRAVRLSHTVQYGALLVTAMSARAIRAGGEDR